MPGLPKPTGQSVSAVHQRLIKEWGPRLAIDGEFKAIIQGTNQIETLPDSSERNMQPVEIHARRAGGIIEHGNGLLMARPTFHAEPPSLGTEDTREAELVERATAGLFEEQLLANDFWPGVGRDLLSYGRAFIKCLPVTAEWLPQMGYPVRRQDESAAKYLKRVREYKGTVFPFVIRHLPALTVLPLLDGQDNVIATVEEKFVSAQVLAEELGSQRVADAIAHGRLKWYDQLPVVEYADHEWVGYFLASMMPMDRAFVEPPHRRQRAYEELRVWPHGLGKHPIVMIPGIVTGDRELTTRYRSFLADSKDALELYDFCLSRLATMVWAYYLPSYIWRLADRSGTFVGKERPTLQVKLGGTTVLYSDEDLRTLDVPQGLPDALLLLKEADDIIQRHALEDVLFGRVSGAAPAYQVNLRINVARSKLTPIAQHMAAGISKVMENFFRGVEQVGEMVVAGGEEVTVALAKKYRTRVTATITPKSPVDRNQSIGVAAMALQFGLPWDWIVEKILDIEEPATLRLMNDIRAIEDSPQVKERLLKDALERLELLVEKEDFVDASEIDLSSLPPEFSSALRAIIEGGPAPTKETPTEVVTGPTSAGPPGLGRGPFPEGAAPQTIQGGRGLLTQKAQPQPAAPQAGTETSPGPTPTVLG